MCIVSVVNGSSRRDTDNRSPLSSFDWIWFGETEITDTPHFPAMQACSGTLPEWPVG